MKKKSKTLPKRYVKRLKYKRRANKGGIGIDREQVKYLIEPIISQLFQNIKQFLQQYNRQYVNENNDEYYDFITFFNRVIYNSGNTMHVIWTSVSPVVEKTILEKKREFIEHQNDFFNRNPLQKQIIHLLLKNLRLIEEILQNMVNNSDLTDRIVKYTFNFFKNMKKNKQNKLSSNYVQIIQANIQNFDSYCQSINIVDEVKNMFNLYQNTPQESSNSSRTIVQSSNIESLKNLVLDILSQIVSQVLEYNDQMNSIFSIIYNKFSYIVTDAQNVKLISNYLFENFIDKNKLLLFDAFIHHERFDIEVISQILNEIDNNLLSKVITESIDKSDNFNENLQKGWETAQQIISNIYHGKITFQITELPSKIQKIKCKAPLLYQEMYQNQNQIGGYVDIETVAQQIFKDILIDISTKTTGIKYDVYPIKTCERHTKSKTIEYKNIIYFVNQICVEQESLVTYSIKYILNSDSFPSIIQKKLQENFEKNPLHQIIIDLVTTNIGVLKTFLEGLINDKESNQMFLQILQSIINRNFQYGGSVDNLASKLKSVVTASHNKNKFDGLLNIFQIVLSYLKENYQIANNILNLLTQNSDLLYFIQQNSHIVVKLTSDLLITNNDFQKVDRYLYVVKDCIKRQLEYLQLHAGYQKIINDILNSVLQELLTGVKVQKPVSTITGIKSIYKNPNSVMKSFRTLTKLESYNKILEDTWNQMYPPQMNTIQEVTESSYKNSF